MSHPEQAPALLSSSGGGQDGAAATGSKAPRVVYPTAAALASRESGQQVESAGSRPSAPRPPLQVCSAGNVDTVGATGSDAGGRGVGRTRVWGPVALRKLGEGSNAPKACRNQFADVALRWASGLLRQVGPPGGGVVFEQCP